jgi:glycosyltransferase involved in cell wall biosynthesis
MRIAALSFRLGEADGVSVESDKWAKAWAHLGCDVVTVAGSGRADRLVPGLAWGAAAPPARAEVDGALADVDLVVVENLLSLPLQPSASAVVADVLRGRPAILRHHDLPWQRPRFADAPPPPDDPAWAHVTINRRSAAQLAERCRIEAVTIYNRFMVDPPRVDRAAARAALGLAPDGLLVLQPTRAIERKDVPAGVRLAEALGAAYWLTGPAEEGYGQVLASVLDAARVPVLHRPVAPGQMHLAYAACDIVAFPSTAEGFGNPVIESAVHRRPLAVADYPVLRELAEFGFRWFPAASPSAWRSVDDSALSANGELARRHFSLADLPAALEALCQRQGWKL